MNCVETRTRGGLGERGAEKAELGGKGERGNLERGERIKGKGRWGKYAAKSCGDENKRG